MHTSLGIKIKKDFSLHVIMYLLKVMLPVLIHVHMVIYTLWWSWNSC